MRAEGEVYSALGEVFADVFARDDLVIRPELSSRDVEGWDSFKHIEVVMATEERFGVKFTTRDLDSLQNVGDLVRIIMARKP